MDNKVIVITGASSDMGIATIKRMKEVYNEPVFVCVTRNQENLKRKFEEWELCQERIVFAECDLTHYNEAMTKIQSVLNNFSRVDILINIAGLFIAKPFLETEIEDFDTIVNSNLKSCYMTIRIVVPYMLSNNGGSIVNISSALGIHTIKSGRSSIYDASKAGIIQLTKSLAVEFGSDSIKVNCICPGILVPSDDARDNHMSYQTIKNLSSHLKDQPLKRLGTSKNIADAIVFLSGVESDWTTGAVLSVDGGIIL